MHTDKAALATAKRWLKSQRGHGAPKLTLSTLCSALSGIALIAQAVLLAHCVNQLVFAAEPWQQLIAPLSALATVMLVRVVLNRSAERLAFEGARQIKQVLRRQLYTKLQALGPHYIASTPSAELSQLLHTGVEALEMYYARYLPAASLCAIVPLAILALVLPLDWLTGLIFIVTAPLVPFFMILIGLKAEQLNQKHWQQLNRLANHFLDILQGIAQLKLFNASRAEGQAIAKISDKYRRSTLSVLKVAFLSSLALEFLATLSVALVAVTVGFRLFWGELDFATGFTLLLLAPEFFLPFRTLGAVYHDKMKGVEASVQMLPILSAEAPTCQTQVVPTAKVSRIELQNVSFSHCPGTEGNEVLRDINACFEGPGQHIITGPSGAGKSTLNDLLLGFISPQSGQIFADGYPLASLAINSWHAQLAFVPQNPQLLCTTVLENIRLAKPCATDDEVFAAAREAGVDQFIEQLEGAWQHCVQERGTSISGGQKQRIAMARALLKRAPVLILDEPSAQLDSDSQLWIEKALHTYSLEHLVIVNTHRLHSASQAKSVTLLDRGALIDSGTHAELIARCPRYRALVEAAI
ncbi:MAG: thiol reductant ABC exporter subunit CydD [Pseudomonadales bacterium]